MPADHTAPGSGEGEQQGPTPFIGRIAGAGWERNSNRVFIVRIRLDGPIKWPMAAVWEAWPVVVARVGPAPCDEPPKGEDGLPAEGRSPAGAVPEGQAPDPSPTREELQAEIDRLQAALAESERKRVETITPDQAAILASMLEPLARADRAIGEELGPFRFETGSGYRDLSREDLRSAGEAYRLLKAASTTSSQTTAQEVENAD